MAERLIHRAKLFYYPGDGQYQIRCLDCDEILVENPLQIDVEFYIPGSCEVRDKHGIQTSDGIGIEDSMV